MCHPLFPHRILLAIWDESEMSSPNPASCLHDGGRGGRDVIPYPRISLALRKEDGGVGGEMLALESHFLEVHGHTKGCIRKRCVYLFGYAPGMPYATALRDVPNLVLFGVHAVEIKPTTRRRREERPCFFYYYCYCCCCCAVAVVIHITSLRPSRFF